MSVARHPWQGGKCRVPMWVMGCPAGFCDDEAYGEQHPKEVLSKDRGYFYPNRPIPYCHGPCCPGHGGPKKDEPRFFRDGTTEDGYSMWCCVGPDFENLQESPAGFDGNPLVARQNYLKASVDTHPQGGDVKQAPLVSGPVPKGGAHD